MIEKDRLISIYNKMKEIREFELKLADLFEKNVLRGSVHLCVGQEAIASTVCSLLRDSDYITSTHRGHGHCIAKGAELNRAMAELMGKDTGYCRGRSGSMHIADYSKGNLGANAIVGGGIPIAVGAALAAQLKGTDQVAIPFFGDGAANEGTFHESLNMAALWKLPVIFICENNGYGLSTSFADSTSVDKISTRAVAYGIPGYTVDGNDVFAIDEAAQKAIARAKAGEGPTLIECVTYRWFGHWNGDPQNYRPREEVAEWKKKCPLARFRNYLLDNKITSEEELESIDSQIAMNIEEAVRFGLESPEPDAKVMLEDVFYNN